MTLELIGFNKRDLNARLWVYFNNCDTPRSQYIREMSESVLPFELLRDIVAVIDYDRCIQTLVIINSLDTTLRNEPIEPIITLFELLLAARTPDHTQVQCIRFHSK